MPDTSRPRTGVRRVPLLIGLLVVAGCGKSVFVEEPFPSPLVESLPLSVGVFYDAELEGFSFVDTTIDGATWSIDLGSSNVRLFDRIFASLFTRVVRLNSLDDPQGSADLDAIISPAIEEFAFLAPSESGSQFWAVSIRYRMDLYDGQGKPLTSWPLVAYGKSRSRALRGDESLAEATNYALRDAAAALAVEIPERSEVLGILNPTPPETTEPDPEAASLDDTPSETTGWRHETDNDRDT